MTATSTSQELAFLREFVRSNSAIELDPAKDYLLESRLAPVMREESIRTVTHLVGRLKNERWGALHAKVIDAMTTNETLFFRDGHPFEALRKTVLPSVLAARAARKELNIWSAAASTGQEAYSIAMLLKEYFPELLNWKVKIFGTDLSEQALQQAKEARYGKLEVTRGLPEAMRKHWMKQDGDDWVVRDEVRKLVEFRAMNLTKPWFAMPNFDVVFLRNVLIYFSDDTKRQVLSRMLKQMAPDGWLFVGTGENTIPVEVGFESIRTPLVNAFRPKRAPGA